MGNWNQAAAGGLGGAALALVLVFGAAKAGLLPASGPAIHDYLVTHPEVLVDMSNRLQANQEAQTDADRQAATDKIGTKAFFNPKLAFVTGPADAKTTLVEFFDYNCIHCRNSFPAVRKFYEANKGSARFAFIEFPIKGDDSVVASRAAIAARKQPDKYLAFHFLLMSEKYVVTPELIYADAQKAGLDVAKLKADMADSSVDLAIASAHTLAEAAKIDGTPAFIIDGKMWEGEVTDKSLKQMTKG